MSPRPLFARAFGARLRAGLALAAALTLGGGLLAPEPARAAACKPPSYCAQPGACLSIGQVRDQVRGALGEGWRVSRVRLVGHAPTQTCLWYEVRVSGPGGPKIVYWNVTGGRAR